MANKIIRKIQLPNGEVYDIVGKPSDWAVNNENEVGFIKNRTHWVEQSFEEFLPEQDTIYIQEANGQIADLDGVDWQDINTLAITIDGTRYICEKYSDRLDTYSYGDSRLTMDGADVTNPMDVPFKIECIMGPPVGGSLFEEVCTWYLYLNPSIENEPHTIKIEIPAGEEIHPLDKKFLPDEAAMVDEVLLKRQQDLTDDEIDQVRKNLKLIGKGVEGQTFIIDGQEVVAEPNAEVFGDYDNNIATGQWSVAEGSYTIAKGRVAHAEGAYSQALQDGCHVEGYQTKATGYWSHAEGEMTRVTSYASHAEGSYTKMPDGSTRYGTASGYASHIEGGGCYAQGSCSHSEGLATTTKGNYSHSEGRYTVAGSAAQHVEGISNIEDTEGKYIHIAGNGDFGAPSNAYTLDWDGNGWFAGGITVGEEKNAVLTDANAITNDEIDAICV